MQSKFLPLRSADKLNHIQQILGLFLIMLTKRGLFSRIDATETSKDSGQISTELAASPEALLEFFRPLFSLPVTLVMGGRNPDTNEIWAMRFWGNEKVP